MDKILQTQMTNVYNKIYDQSEEIEIAARLLAQAVGTDGNILLKTFHDFKFLESFLIEGEESLPDIKVFESIQNVTTPDRILVVAKDFDEEVKAFVQELNHKDMDYCLVCNKNKEDADFFNSIFHYIDLSSARKLVPTADFDRIINPYVSAFLFIYYTLYIFIDEMTSEDEQ
ncbi:DUF2529 family protein [Phocicoccus pinnipedialis]|uniref:DUF2529 domain-containing protein n=1 Tax=Phocicoccus pinnipedialis TaxID=110845 RepID=A0A6V7R507_9BACL|nr:DUF2529 family protein [Jeotgalicoccus pinnipedialis]MBP1939954.1 hypothetical protein [Jeotgalicoccus pinnipedialis]CAD2072098.1 hypothetical protein JEOPIN946_00296 [Jeotgalicoccus pinnipedialis]